MHFLTTKLSHINRHFEHFVCFINPPEPIFSMRLRYRLRIYLIKI
nr:MAG TPA: hypothetical protein [Caudoviricetes sp.]